MTKLTIRKLAEEWRPYGVVMRAVRVGEMRAKGYYLEDFKDVFKRYLPKTELLELLDDAVKEGI